MNKIRVLQSRGYKQKIIFSCLLILIIIFGAAYVFYTWRNNLNLISTEALKIARITATSLPEDQINQLGVVANDIDKIEYQQIKNSLMDIANIKKDIRFVYLYTQKDGKIYFLADSEPIDSVDYSPPGQEFAEASEQDKRPLLDGQALITDPVTDRWGRWVSILVPIKDHQTGKVIAVLGMDYPADKWSAEATTKALQAGIFVLFLLLLLLVFYIIIRSRDYLRESGENFRSFFESSNDIILVSNKDGKILYANHSTVEKLGYSKRELQNMYVLSLNQKNQRKEAEKIFAEMFAGQRDYCPLPLERKNGSILPAKTHVWFGKWNGQDCIFGISEDLGAEQESLDKFNKIFEHNPALMAISSLTDQKFTDVNQAFLNKLGYSREEVIGKSSKDLKIFVEPKKQRAVAEQLNKQGYVHDVELQIKTKTGDVLDGVFSGEIIETQGKKYFLTVMIDQTERRKAENVIKESQEKISKALLQAERLNKSMVDREIKMIELKSKIRKLEDKIN